MSRLSISVNAGEMTPAAAAEIIATQAEMLGVPRAGRTDADGHELVGRKGRGSARAGTCSARSTRSRRRETPLASASVERLTCS